MLVAVGSIIGGDLLAGHSGARVVGGETLVGVAIGAVLLIMGVPPKIRRLPRCLPVILVTYVPYAFVTGDGAAFGAVHDRSVLILMLAGMLAGEFALIGALGFPGDSGA